MKVEKLYKSESENQKFYLEKIGYFGKGGPRLFGKLAADNFNSKAKAKYIQWNQKGKCKSESENQKACFNSKAKYVKKWRKKNISEKLIVWQKRRQAVWQIGVRQLIPDFNSKAKAKYISSNKGRRKKNGHLTVRLTVRVDH